MFLYKFLFVSIFQTAGILLCDISQNVAKMKRLRNLDFITRSEPYCVLWRIPLYRTPKGGLTEELVRFVCQTSNDFFFLSCCFFKVKILSKVAWFTKDKLLRRQLCMAQVSTLALFVGITLSYLEWIFPGAVSQEQSLQQKGISSG